LNVPDFTINKTSCGNATHHLLEHHGSAPRTCCLSVHTRVQVSGLQSLCSPPSISVSAVFVSRFPVSRVPLWRREHKKILHISASGGYWGFGAAWVHCHSSKSVTKPKAWH